MPLPLPLLLPLSLPSLELFLLVAPVAGVPFPVARPAV
jgi:hypothetical protein